MATMLARIQRIDDRLVQAAGAAVRSPLAVACMRLATRSGDWPLPFVVGLLVLIFAGGGAGARFSLATALALVAQRSLKIRFARVRPCLVAGGPAQRAPIPDHGSFPSGHTLHAVMAAVTVAVNLPMLLPLFAPIAVLVAVSRVALGVHYPSDVFAGGLLGAGFAAAAWLPL
jgi:undecaprenyl-diphosphatase